MSKKKLTWTTEKRKPSDLIQLEFNPRKITEARQQKLLESLEKWDLVEIPAINTDNRLIAGNQRIKILILAGRGEEEIDVRVPSKKLTEKEVKEYNLIANTHAGEFDFEMLLEEFADIDLKGLGIDIPGFEEWQEKELEKSLEAQEDDDFDPTPPLEPKTQPGDLYEIGPHRLLCGDATLPETYTILMAGKQADLVITDPPYNVDYVGKTEDALKIVNDKMSDSGFYNFLFDFYAELFKVTKPGAAFYIWHASSEVINFAKALVESVWLLKQQLIWVKDVMVLGRQDYQWKHEPCLYGWKPGASHYFIDDRTKTTVTDDATDYNKMKKHELIEIIKSLIGPDKPTTVIHEKKPSRSSLHPTMKPVPLIAKLLKNSSKIGWLVVDPFSGSGTTMLTCEQLSRTAYCLELDPRYCDVIVKRLVNWNPGLKVIKNGKDVTNEWN